MRRGSDFTRELRAIPRFTLGRKRAAGAYKAPAPDDPITAMVRVNAAVTQALHVANVKAIKDDIERKRSEVERELEFAREAMERLQESYRNRKSRRTTQEPPRPHGRFLRKRGDPTGFLYPWTEALAKRPDMYEVSL